jgi:hypothetical protein
LYPSPNIMTMKKSRRMKWAGHVLRIGQKGNTHKILVTKPEGKITMNNAKIILKLILQKYDGGIDCIRESG